MQLPTSFADVLRRHRLASGLTQEELAERAGLSARAISDLERGVKRLPQLPTVRALAQALGLFPNESVDLRAAARPPRPASVAYQPERPRRLAHRHNLPLALTSFVGRERQVRELRASLRGAPSGEEGGVIRGTRLLTLIGAGGCGKTRLALEVAAGLLDDYVDGIWLVELAALADPALVPGLIAATIGVAEEAGRPVSTTLAEVLRARSLLLLLDNCEHLLDACAALAAALLRVCPAVHVLATSREPLGIAGEVVWRVPPLTLPPIIPASDASPRDLTPSLTPSAGENFVTVSAMGSLEGVRRAEAVRLFVDRAAEARGDFVLTDRNALSVAEVCRQLDGIPLAIELAAARLRALSVDQVLQRLDNRFRLLQGGSRTALPRQQTLRAAIDWSYDLLGQTERAVFCRLSVFAGGCTLEAAEAVCGDEGLGKVLSSRGGQSKSEIPAGGFPPVPSEEVLDLLVRLIDKSLVQAEDELDGGERYRMLETLREFGGERLLEAGEADAVRQRHGQFFLGLAARAAPELSGPRQTAWLSLLDRERENLWAALAWYITTGQAEPGLRLATTLQRFWETRGYSHAAREQLAALLALPGADDLPALRVRASSALDTLAFQHGDLAAVQAREAESLQVSRQSGDRPAVARSLFLLGAAALNQNQPAAAGAPLEESLALFRELGDQQGIAEALQQLGLLWSARGEVPVARSLLEESLGMLRALGDRRCLAITLVGLGSLAVRVGDFATSRACFREGVSILRELDDRWLIAKALAYVAAESAARGLPGRALLLAGAATALADAIRTPLSPLTATVVQQATALAGAALSDEARAAAWAQGRMMPLDEAVAAAFDDSPPA